MYPSLPTDVTAHSVTATSLYSKLSRLIAVATVGLALIAFGTSCGSTSKSAKSAETTESGTTGDSQASASATDSTQTSDSTLATASHTMYVNVDVANVRGGPAKDQPIVAKLKFLDAVATTGKVDGDWIEIQLMGEDGIPLQAWIHNALLSVSADQARAVHGTP